MDKLLGKNLSVARYANTTIYFGGPDGHAYKMFIHSIPKEAIVDTVRNLSSQSLAKL